MIRWEGGEGNTPLRWGRRLWESRVRAAKRETGQEELKRGSEGGREILRFNQCVLT